MRQQERNIERIRYSGGKDLLFYIGFQKTFIKIYDIKYKMII